LKSTGSTKGIKNYLKRGLMIKNWIWSRDGASTKLK